MSRTAEIVTEARVVRVAVNDANACGVQALEQATELMEQAAAHGWVGVAATLQDALDALEVTLTRLGSVHSAVTETLGALDAITEQMSGLDVADHLDRALNHVGQVRTGVEAASSGLDDARRAGERAGSPDSLMGILQIVRDGMDSVWRRVDAVRGSIESERQNAGSWGK